MGFIRKKKLKNLKLKKVCHFFFDFPRLDFTKYLFYLVTKISLYKVFINISTHKTLQSVIINTVLFLISTLFLISAPHLSLEVKEHVLNVPAMVLDGKL